MRAVAPASVKAAMGVGMSRRGSGARPLFEAAASCVPGLLEDPAEGVCELPRLWNV